jgi:hypothetical protein
MVGDVEQAVEAIVAARERTDPARSLLVGVSYETIYFPAQRIHFARDEPRAGADLVVPNDHRLTAGPTSGGPPPSRADGANAPAPGGA